MEFPQSNLLVKFSLPNKATNHPKFITQLTRRLIMTLDEYLNRMQQDLQLRGMSESTQESYLYAVRQISEHFNKTPDQITED